MTQQARSSTEAVLPAGVGEATPHTHQPWDLSHKARAKLRQVEQKASEMFKRVALDPTDPDSTLVCQLFAHTAPAGVGIRKIWVIENPIQEKQFGIHLVTQDIEAKKFPPDLSKEENSKQRHEALKTWEKATSYFGPIRLIDPEGKTHEIRQVKMLPLWAGGSDSDCASIASSGFREVGHDRLLKGPGTGEFKRVYAPFGEGIYLSNSLKVLQKAGGKGHWILAWASMREPFPVIGDKQHPELSSDVELLREFGAYKAYNTHFIPTTHVDGSLYYPSLKEQHPEAYEVVVFSSSQTLPRFWVETETINPVAVTEYTDEKLFAACAEGNKALLKAWLEQDKRRLWIKHHDSTLMEAAAANGQGEMLAQAVQEFYRYAFDPDVAKCIHKIAVALQDESARPFFELALYLYNKIYQKKETPEVRTFLQDLQTFLKGQNEEKSAEELFQLGSLFPSEIRRGYRLVNLRPIHPYFVGRQDILQKLSHSFFGDPNNNTTKENLVVRVLHGSGGVGKSEIATAFSNREADRFAFVWWITCDASAAYDQAYRELAKFLNIFVEDKEPIETVRSRVHHALAEYPGKLPWLLVFDNAEERLALPQAGNGRIVATSRRANIWEIADRLPVDAFSEEEAVQLLSEVTQQPPSEPMKDLAQALDYFPLAVSEAGHYLKQHPECSIEGYIDLLKKSPKTALEKQSEQEARYPKSLAASWQPTVEVIKKKCPEALRFLEFCSFLYAEDIPVDWVTLWIEDTFEIPEKRKKRRMKDKILSTLVNYGLVKYDDQKRALSLHRLRQQLTRSHINQLEVAAKYTLNFLARTAEPWSVYNQADWGDYEVWQKHAEEALALEETQYAPDAVAAIQAALGEWLSEHRGRAKEALNLLRASLDLRRQFFADDHPTIANTLGFMGETLRSIGKINEALGHLLQALEHLNQSNQYCEKEKIYCLHTLGKIQLDLGKPEEALAYMSEGLELARQGDRSELATQLSNIGATFSSAGKKEEALKYYQEALENYRTAYGENHPDVATCMNNIGWALGGLNKEREAISYYLRALEIFRSSYGENHPKVAATLNNLGKALHGLGEAEQALDYFHQALSLFRQQCGEEHPGVTSSLSRIGSTLQNLNRLDEALIYHKKALALERQIYGETHSWVALPWIISDLYCDIQIKKRRGFIITNKL